MYRYTTAWEELDTEFIKEDDNGAYFKAETPGFSWFA
jgi:PGF-pre-PGF domain-containing protein